MSLKLVPAALLLFFALAAGIGQLFKPADATVVNIGVTPDTVTNGGLIQVRVEVGGPDTTESTQVAITGVSAPSSATLNGTLVVQSCTPACPGDEGKSGTSVSVDTDNLTEINLGLILNCDQNWTARVTAEPGEADETSLDVNCNPFGAGGGGVAKDQRDIPMYGVYQVVLSADPNVLPCEGGTTTLTAEALNATGDVIPGLAFRFYTTAAGSDNNDGTGGVLVQTSPNTAKLTLGPNQFYVKVTASLADDIDVEVDLATTFVSLQCNNGATLVVTADPNVIPCTGTTTISASVRDKNGHVVKGRGYHFVTSAGILKVNPNNADNEEATATLTLRPGDGDATVAVSSGLLFGTYEEIDSQEGNFVVDETNMVTVKQNCLSTTTGQVLVNSSQKTMACGENVFIGLHVVDQDIQTVIDNTPLTLIATAGGFYGGEGASGPTLLSAAQVPTSHGEANTIYTAPANFNGEVKITAASGDAYGFTKIDVTCVVAGAGTGTITTAPACVDIGDGVCIPSNSITPPNTGSGGLK